LKKEKYLCVRDFAVGYGGKLSGYERALTDICENFRMQGGTLCDMYGVERKTVLPEVPLCVYPLPMDAYFSGCLLYGTGQGVKMLCESDLSIKSFSIKPVTKFYALGEYSGKSAIAFPCVEGLAILNAPSTISAQPVITWIPTRKLVDVAYCKGKWAMLDKEGFLTLTTPYDTSVNALTELTPPTVGQARRVLCVEEKIILLTARAIYVLSGTNPEDFVLSMVPVPEMILCDTAATDGKTLYFLTEKSLFSYSAGKLEREAKLPFAFSSQGEGCALVKDGTYYFACQTERGKKEGLFDPDEKGVFMGAGRGITSFAQAEDDSILVTYFKPAIGKICEECTVEGSPLPKIWRSRPTDFGRLNAYKILTSVSVWAQGRGRLRVQSERGASVLPLTDGDNAKRLTLTGARFIMEITSAHPGTQFVKPVITFTEGGEV